MTFSSCKSHQPTQPDDISLPSMQCGHAKVIASHDYKRLMFNWLYRTLKQTEQRYNNVSQEGISAFMMTYLLFIKNYELTLIEFDVFMLLMEDVPTTNVG